MWGVQKSIELHVQSEHTWRWLGEVVQACSCLFHFMKKRVELRQTQLCMGRRRGVCTKGSEKSEGWVLRRMDVLLVRGGGERMGVHVWSRREVDERSPINTSSVPVPLSRTSFSCKKVLPTLFISLSPAVTAWHKKPSVHKCFKNA